jgi:hypothetical protein
VAGDVIPSSVVKTVSSIVKKEAVLRAEAGCPTRIFAHPPGRVSAPLAQRWRQDQSGGSNTGSYSHAGAYPDSIALLDERNGLLFTGDTFYPGPIYLYRPETDLEAYVASVKRLAGVASRLRLLLPAHNVPVTEPGDLPRVVEAIQQVRHGHVKSVPKDGNREYVFEGFSFLMSQ